MRKNKLISVFYDTITFLIFKLFFVNFEINLKESAILIYNYKRLINKKSNAFAYYASYKGRNIISISLAFIYFLKLDMVFHYCLQFYNKFIFQFNENLVLSSGKEMAIRVGYYLRVSISLLFIVYF